MKARKAITKQLQDNMAKLYNAYGEHLQVVAGWHDLGQEGGAVADSDGCGVTSWWWIRRKGKKRKIRKRGMGEVHNNEFVNPPPTMIDF